MTNEESNCLEDDPTNNKLGFLPLSPPTHQKSPQDSHLHSSSSPVGRPPPLTMDTDMVDPRDRFIFQAFNDLFALQEGESLPPVPDFPITNQEQMDFDLADILTSNEDEYENESMLDFFPALPNNNNTKG